MNEITKLIRLQEIAKKLKTVKIKLFFSDFLITTAGGTAEVRIFDYESISKIFSIEIKNQKSRLRLWFKLLKYLIENKYIKRADYDYRIKVIFANKKKKLVFSDVDRVLRLVEGLNK